MNDTKPSYLNRTQTNITFSVKHPHKKLTVPKQFFITFSTTITSHRANCTLSIETAFANGWYILSETMVPAT